MSINKSDMGLIIVSGPRTGSTNLMLSLSSSYSIPYIFEPNITVEFDYSKYKNNVVKYVLSGNSDVGYYKKLIEIVKQFDIIILLDRKNKKEQAESFYCLRNYGTFYKKWGREYINRESDQFKNFLTDFKNKSNLLLKLSNDLNLKIDYYEDLFNNKSLNDKRIVLDIEYLSNKYKLRQDISKIL